VNKSSTRSTIARTFALLFVLVAAAGAQTYSVLTNFDGTNGGAVYATPLIDGSGNIFGTTQEGGSGNCGVVYELVSDGVGGYTNKTLYSFTCGDDGADPYGGVVMDSEGNLYGTTLIGGAYACGVVYELVNHGGGSYALEVIHAFTGGRDGSSPQGDLVRVKGSLYGVTALAGGGCEKGCGTVYRLTKSGSKWIETVLHVFNDPGDGEEPAAGVAIDRSGNIYGTTATGGSLGDGTVFRLSPQSSGNYKETILHSFDFGKSGCYITSGVVLDSAGNLYGTAFFCGGGDRYGTVYQLKHSGSKYEFRVILRFNGTNGEHPYDAPGHLEVDSSGNVYGTADAGGAYDYGVVFKLARGSFLYTDLHDFNSNGTDGYAPYGGVSFDSLGNLYGTTIAGGSGNGGFGTVWRIAKP
jgi:uncharacterized repeat protein (TIGR03803 family)